MSLRRRTRLIQFHVTSRGLDMAAHCDEHG